MKRRPIKFTLARLIELMQRKVSALRGVRRVLRPEDDALRWELAFNQAILEELQAAEEAAQPSAVQRRLKALEERIHEAVAAKKRN